MEFQELVETKKCPECGAKSPSAAERCGVCGADLKFTSANREMETVSSIRDSSFQGGAPPPPPPPGEQKPPARQASAAAGFVKTFFKDIVLPLAVACGVVALFISAGDKPKNPAPGGNGQTLDNGPRALEAFMEYPLRYGDEKGKKMRQFWADYQKSYEMSRTKGLGDQEAEVRFFQQPSAAAGIYKVFVAERLPEAKPRVFPFSVNLETGEVTGLSKCEFSPGTEEEYVSSCADSREMFPDGV